MDDIIEIELIETVSANVNGVGYSEKHQILAIRMYNGHLYYYLDIPKLHFDEILKAKSIGSYLHRNIKGNFRYTRIK